MLNKEVQYLYLSYFMDEVTPLYGGGKGVNVIPDRSIDKGDTANTKILTLHNHSGTHVDYPNHFFSDGMRSESYGPEAWIFNAPHLLNLPAKDSEILSLTNAEIASIPQITDFLILKTGFGQYRDLEKYWKYNPGLSPEMANQLRDNFPFLRAIGMDLISVTSFQHRETGREAHRNFLGGDSPILLIEDMDLSRLEHSPKTVSSFPLLIDGLDGSPITVIAKIAK